MAETYKKLNIDIYNGTNAIITQVQQDTNSRYLDVFLYDNGLPVDLTDHEVRIYARKPLKSGQEYAFEVWNNGEITEPTNGRCQFLLTTQMLAQVGYVELQVEMWLNNEKILSTPIFIMCVTESLRTNGTVESSNEYGALVVLFQNLYESIDLMTEMVQNFGIAGDVAQQIPVTTFWEMLEAVYSMTKQAYENASVAQVLEEIGDTTDTGATESTGTIYGKLNDIISKTGGLNSSLGTDYFMSLDEWVRKEGELWNVRLARFRADWNLTTGGTQTFTFTLPDGPKKVLCLVLINSAFSSVNRLKLSSGTITIDGIAYSGGSFLTRTLPASALSTKAIYTLSGSAGNDVDVLIDIGYAETNAAVSNPYYNMPVTFDVKSTLEISFALSPVDSSTIASDGSVFLSVLYIPYSEVAT